MGYFANGTEGALYAERYCCRCRNMPAEDDGECPIMEAHLEFNYEQQGHPKIERMLDILIPRSGSFNGQCKLFRHDPNKPLPGQMGFAFGPTPIPK
jgi:hypothetical protein